jgi:hypothetical protein
MSVTPQALVLAPASDLFTLAYTTIGNDRSDAQAIVTATSAQTEATSTSYRAIINVNGLCY